MNVIERLVFELTYSMLSTTQLVFLLKFSTQLAEAVKFIDCISGYDIKQSNVWHLFWSFLECGVPLLCHYSVSDRDPCISQIELFDNLTMSKQITDIKLNC